MPSPEFTPLPQVKSQRLNFELFQNALPPYVDQEQIGIEIGLLEQVLYIAGIKHLTVTGLGEVRKTRPFPQISQINSHGEAVTHLITTKDESQLYQANTSPEKNEYWKPHYYDWVDGTISVNTQEVAQTIGDNRQIWPRGSREAAAWAHHLNLGLKQGVKWLGYKHLIENVPTRQKVDFYFLTSISSTYALVFGNVASLLTRDSLLQPTEFLALGLLFLPGVHKLGQLIDNSYYYLFQALSGRHPQSGIKRSTLFVGYEFDNYLQILVATNRHNFSQALGPKLPE